MTPSMIRLRKESVFVFFCPQAPLGRGPLTAFFEVESLYIQESPIAKAKSWKFELNFCV